MKEKINIDIWRFIASFLIVAIHISPLAKINLEIDFYATRILGRIAVPLFLMITGYYLLEKSLKDQKYLKGYTKKILMLYGFSIVLYLPINIYMEKYSHINVLQIIKDILLNGTFYHLWYFPALILGLWITNILLKKVGEEKTSILLLLLYLIGLFGDSYYGIAQRSKLLSAFYNIIFHISDYTRNGLFFTPIFLYMGYAIKTHKSKSSFHLHFSIIFFLCMTLEGSILHHYHFQRHDSMYIFLIPSMYFLFQYLMENNKTSNKRIRKIATGIYLLHPLFIILIRYTSKLFGLEKILVENNLILYLLVSFGTLIFMILFEKLKGVLKNEKLKFRNEQSMD